jgi:Sec-independent protein translocase protein TatA
MKGVGEGMKEFKKASRLNDEPEKKETGVKESEIKVSENK